MNDTDLAVARTFHTRLVDLLRVEFASLGAFLETLAEFDRRKLFRDLGHADLFAYLHRGLKLSRAAAHHRRAGAWLVQRFPEVLEPIREGKLCFTTAAVLASVATEENLAAVLPRFYGLSKQEALELAAELKPRTLVPTRTVVTRVQASRPAEPVEEGKVTVPGIRPGEFGIPRMEVERADVKRDQGKCQWKLPDGEVCGATVRLEIDHMVPRGKGGPSTVENCRILCRSHNLEAARQVYGEEHMDLFTRGVPRAREATATYGACPRTATVPRVPDGRRADRGPVRDERRGSTVHYP